MVNVLMAAMHIRLLLKVSRPALVFEALVHRQHRFQHVIANCAATIAAFRAGGDGDSILKVDLRNAAGFVRHKAAQVNNWLLPIKSMTMEYSCSMPLADESKVLQKYIT